MENRNVNDRDLEKVVGGWDENTPDEIRFCPECGAVTTGGAISGHNPLRAWVVCTACGYQFEIFLEGPNANQKTGRNSKTLEEERKAKK